MIKVAYFDNAATTYVKPNIVHDFMHSFYSANSVNIGRGRHSLLTEGKLIIDDTRKRLIELFGGSNDHVAILTPSATEAINIVLQGQEWKKGDNVYITPFEHNAVFRVLKHLEQKIGIRINVLSFDGTGQKYSIESIKAQFIQKPPAFVCLTHVSNAFGIVCPICAIGEVVKNYDAKIMVDCAQSAGLLETSIVKSKADYMIFAGHKTLYGPFGCSGFICKKIDKVKPLIFGGTGVDSASELMPQNLPERLEAGSVNILSISGLNASLKWIAEIGRDRLLEQEKKNYDALLEILNKYDFIKIVGQSKSNISIVSCQFNGLPIDSVGDILSQNGVIVRTGLHCAPLSHKQMNTFPEGTVRFSVNYFTSDEDFSMLKNALTIIENNI